MRIVPFLFVVLSFFMDRAYGRSLKIVRGNSSYPPNEIMSPDGSLSGIHIDIVRAVAQILKIEVEFESLPWSRAVENLKNGKSDAITHMGKTTVREKFALFEAGNILSSSEISIICMKKKCPDIAYDGSMKSLSGYQIVSQLGFKFGDRFDNSVFLAKHLASTPAQQYEFLLQKRADIGVQSLDSFKSNMKLKKYLRYKGKLAFLKNPITKAANYIAFSKHRPGLQGISRKFSKEIIKFRKTKAYQDIVAKYE